MFNLPPNFATNFLASQWKNLPLPAADYAGKTVIVTGATSGIGLEAARHFVKLNAAKVILACRNTEKAEAVKADIESSAGRNGVVEVWPLEMGSYESVKEFCRRAESSLERLDVVIENAAVVTSIYQEMEGCESVITINVISTYLMALMLLPKLKQTAAKCNVVPRLVLVSSDAHYLAQFKERTEPNIFEALGAPANMSQDRYGTSKLLLILLNRQLAELLGPPGPVIANNVNPGFCKTELFRTAKFPLAILVNIGLFLLGRTSEMGSRTLLWAAEGGPETHGKFLDSCRIREPSAFVLSEEGAKTQKKAWDQLMKLLDKVEPGVSKNVSA